METKNPKENSKFFLSNIWGNPIFIGIATGLYPLFFYYSRNFTMIDSWEHLGFFLVLFLVVPVLSFSFFSWLSNQGFAARWGKYVLPFLNVFVFLFLLKLILYVGLQKKIILAIFILSALMAFFLHKHFKKWILVQFILATIGLFTLVPVVFKNLTYTDKWAQQPDAIENAVFNKKPNIYYIQPDGYVNFSELKKGFYNYDNSAFETFLNNKNFKNYSNFRSNYDATLASNSATFMMKHHLYKGSTHSGEVAHARNIIVTDNSVLRVFKNNGYKTFFFTEYPYLLMNRPKMGYDISNFEYSEVPFLGTGLENKKEVLPYLNQAIGEKENPKFFFIEIFSPQHISSSSEGKNLAAKKRLEYLKNLKVANKKLKTLVATIKNNDPNALIIIMADHGGYVGMENIQQGNEKTENRDLIFSIFGSMLSIHWPNGDVPKFDDKLKTSVNVFRILFTYLSEDESYLKYLQPDISYGVIYKGASQGVYEYIDEDNSIVLKPKRLFNSSFFQSQNTEEQTE